MGFRSRSATPGTILCLGATVLLAIVSFNTPLLKSQYFLSATYSSGTYDGTIQLGTMGYCLAEAGSTSCVGPTIGYEFDPNTIFNVSTFDIPTVVTKYLTYTLVLHLVALGFAAAATVLGLLSHIETLSLLCFPTCTASLCSSFSLIALIFDLVIFYIAKARIDSVSGASASIGISVWLTLAAWLLAGFSGCAYGIGRCCIGARRNQTSGDPRQTSKLPYDDGNVLRLQALANERSRKEEQGLPAFQEWERTPLTGEEDKYKYEEAPQPVPGALRRDGSVIQGVGQGYGRRNIGGQPPVQRNIYGNPGGWGDPYAQQPQTGYQLSRRGSDSAVTSAGDFVGVGAGGAGVERPEQYGDGYDSQSQGHGYYDHAQHDDYYNDPYSHPQQHATYDDPYRQQTPYDPYSHPAPLTMPTPAPGPGPGPQHYSGAPSSESHYVDPGRPVSLGDPYGGYEDGLGAIGLAAASGAGQHERDYTGSQIHNPTPQHLVNPSTSSQLLHARAEEYDEDEDEMDPSQRPPSYAAPAPAYEVPRNEKSGYGR
ncbi:hypothetical protein P7C73_g1124, partial [Tremellales sp. Uapishka_1]